LRDEIAEAMPRLGEGYDLRPEVTRVETIDNIIYRKSTLILRELAVGGGIRHYREGKKPSDEQWWWFLDEYVGEKRRKTAIRSISVVAGILLLLVAGNFVMDRFFGLSPIEKEARAFTLQGEEALRNGDNAEAIAQYEQALQVLPDMADAQLTLGILYELEGRPEQAREALAKAEDLVGDRPRYLTALARAYNDVGKTEPALEAVDEAIQLNDSFAEAFLIRATIYETIGDTDAAIKDLEQAGDLAQASGQDEIYVLSRMRLGMLLQRSPSTGGGFPGMGF
jgi:tetratricopeptide (TPR) repeat protein